MKDDYTEVADLLIDSNCYVNYGRKENKNIKTTNGDIVPAYLSCRTLISQNNNRKRIEELLVNKMKEIDNQDVVIVGLATAGITWAHSIASKLNLPMLYVRSNRKEYGLGGTIEGGADNIHNKKAFIVDDVLYSGESFYKAKEELKNLNIDTIGVLSICALKDKVVENLRDNNVKVFYLTNGDTLLKRSEEKNILNNEEVKIMKKFYEGE